MSRVATLMLVVLAASCVSVAPEAEFLHTESKGWSAWLDGPAPGSCSNMTVEAILDELAGPGEVEVVRGRNQMSLVIPTFKCRGLTRREAFRRLSEHAGVTLRWASQGEPREFLGLLETESKRASSGIEVKTVVRKTNYGEYVTSKAQNRIAARPWTAGSTSLRVEVSAWSSRGDSMPCTSSTSATRPGSRLPGNDPPLAPFPPR